MVLHRQNRAGLVRLFVVALAVGMFATVGLAVMPSARAAWTGAGLTVANSLYWGGHTFVPGETMSITMRATPGDTIDLVIQNGSGTPSYQRPGIVIPSTGQYTVQFTIPTGWPDSFTYTVTGTDAAVPRTVPFAIETYRMFVWPNRDGFLAGDAVTVGWSVVYAQNGTPTPAGIGDIQVRDSAGASLLSTAQYNITASQGSFSFTLSTSLATVPDFASIDAWFNDTTGARRTVSNAGFGIGNLGITVGVTLPPRGYFEPGESVPVTIASTITGIGGGVFEPNVAVAVNVTDQATGLIVAAYSNQALMTDATGHLTYVFQLGTTPPSGTYQVTATDSAHGSLATASAAPFDVRSPSGFSVTLTLDKFQYLSGDTVTATANVVSTTTQTYTYTWAVLDSSGNVLAYLAGGQSKYSYTTAPNYAGTLQVAVQVNNGTGGVVTAFVSTTVAYGYLSLSLSETQFNGGDTITATASLTSNLITNPTYTWAVQDGSNSVVASTSTSSGSYSFTTPNPASTRYTFYVTATGNGRSVQASQTAYRNDGYYLSILLDKTTYNPGETIVITYSLSAHGTAALPSLFHFYIDIDGVGYKYQDTTSPTGQLTFQVPQGAPTGNELLFVSESQTRVFNYQVVHVGPVNPLVADVGGVPLFDILITLLFVVLLLAVILLWRRTGMGRAPSAAEAGKPSTPPPPPPSGPSERAAGPMSVACKHCGASIEITTSKRPIEVMCPSCGETQVVQ